MDLGDTNLCEATLRTGGELLRSCAVDCGTRLQRPVRTPRGTAEPSSSGLQVGLVPPLSSPGHGLQLATCNLQVKSEAPLGGETR